MGYWPDFNVESVFFIENIVITKNLTDFCFFFNIKTIVQCKEKCRLGKIFERKRI